MTIHIRQFSINSPTTLKAIREIGNTQISDAQENKIFVCGNADVYTPCFENRIPSASKAIPLKIARITSWPLYYSALNNDGVNGRPPTACSECNEKNHAVCMGKINNTASCIFTVSESKFLRPQFVLLGKNWSSGIVDNDVEGSSWGNGQNAQAQWLRGTIFEGGYFTDFIKGKTLTDFSEMERWLLESDPLLGNKIRFDVFIEIFAKELELLRTKFNLEGTDKYIIIWGPGILRSLNRVTQKIYRRNFESLDFLSGYKIRLFGTHYTPRGSVLRSLPRGNDRNRLTIRRIYKTVEERTADSKEDRRRFDFEIMPDLTILPGKIDWLI